MRPADHRADRKPGAPGTAPGTPGAESDAPQVPAATTDALIAALRAAVATGAADAEPLRAAVHTFIEALRLCGEPPERALIAVKGRVADATRRRPDLDPEIAGTLLRQVVFWAVQAYYRAD